MSFIVCCSPVALKFYITRHSRSHEAGFEVFTSYDTRGEKSCRRSETPVRDSIYINYSLSGGDR